MMEIEESLEKAAAATCNLRHRRGEGRAPTENRHCSAGAADLFSCCICLDTAGDPVVTHCGHLYCWPCIYKWLHSHEKENPIHAGRPQSHCPVCSAWISTATLVPLFCAGQPRSQRAGVSPDGLGIPPRPINFAPDLGPKASRLLVPALPDPAAGPRVYVFGSLALMPRELGRERFLNAPNPHLLGRNCRLPVGRDVLRLEESVRRMCFFLFCTMLACLLLF